MPAVVRGGRRQGANPVRRAAPASKGRASAPRNAPATPGKLAAIGRMDLPVGAVFGALAAGVIVLGAVLMTGGRGERVSASMTQGLGDVTANAGLKVDRVYIQGESPEATAVINRAVQVFEGQPLVTVDLAAVRQRVEGVSWVKEAQVVRLLPNTLMVNVTEHDRLAVWQTAGRNYVIDGSGKVIEGADAGRYPGLPLVVGKGADQAAADVLPLIAERPALKGRVEALVRVDERRWDLRLRDGGLIQLPATGQDEALIRLDALDQRERLLELGFARIDLRTPDAVAVRPAGAA